MEREQYHIRIEKAVSGDGARTEFQEARPFADEVAAQLRERGWGGGGQLQTDGAITRAGFFVKGDHLQEALAVVHEAMQKYPLGWRKPETERFPDGQLFERVERNKYLCIDCETIGDFVERYRAMADAMAAWQADGVWLVEGTAEDDYATFRTDNIEVAMKHNFYPVEGGEEEEED